MTDLQGPLVPAALRRLAGEVETIKEMVPDLVRTRARAAPRLTAVGDQLAQLNGLHYRLVSTSQFRSSQAHSRTPDHIKLTTAYATTTEQLGGALSALSRAYAMTGILYSLGAENEDVQALASARSPVGLARNRALLALAKSRDALGDVADSLRIQADALDRPTTTPAERAQAAVAKGQTAPGPTAGQSSPPSGAPSETPVPRRNR